MLTFPTTSRTGRRLGPAALMTAVVLATGPTATAQTPAPRPAVDCGTHDRTSRLLHELTDHHGITGAAVLVTDPTAGRRCGRWAETAGTADRRTGRPMNTTDRLRAGSVTKTFTATLVLRLAAEHRLSLDAPVDRYLPGLLGGGGHDRRPVTVRDLLRHTSGLPDYLDAPEWEHLQRQRFRHFEPRDLVERALELPRPQGSWHYATTNYLVLGMIVREVTGRTPEAEITRRIIRPLGLHDTYWPGDGTRVRGAHSRSYFTDEGGRQVDGTAWNMTFGGVGGALVSSPGDLTRFATALFDGRLLPAAQLAEMRRTVEVDTDRLWPGARYGLGLISTPLSCGGTWWGHAGTVPGGHRALVAVGPRGRSVAVALNEIPASLPAESAFLDLVDASLCENLPSERTTA
ncbi:serine hydrolase [Streptomyces scabiei]|uniref:serine hydrolase domain-containing protein n=1 Tax=Streptomyces scabiei TaxID=1930 RepID=UPI001B30987D|nr:MULTISPECIES: serine hydrolase domain-containing protein [Streptomyces]MBP5873965.1 beta-lactamase family protein [Streptomyces sp. LBUM 1477]MBP5881679.1 beta-lactamase family protein [Streptomyces sp. LBUM 1487]MBP5897452.1 beta-lactamase family protein [Streptomyces sp. LBUM 1488]MDW8471111.1 serine hydrolase domain-containing protein [Streptomyces scabiei]MDX2570701.1 serine hydrolase [Streptomyces scabiei]